MAPGGLAGTGAAMKVTILDDCFDPPRALDCDHMRAGRDATARNDHVDAGDVPARRLAATAARAEVAAARRR